MRASRRLGTARLVNRPRGAVPVLLRDLVHECESCHGKIPVSFENKDIFCCTPPTIYFVLIPSKSSMQVGETIASSSSGRGSRFTVTSV